MFFLYMYILLHLILYLILYNFLHSAIIRNLEVHLNSLNKYAGQHDFNND